jgi:hypothetical protein
MEELFKEFAGSVALGVEVVAVLIIAYGAVEALVRILGLVFRMPATHANGRRCGGASGAGCCSGSNSSWPQTSSGL